MNAQLGSQRTLDGHNRRPLQPPAFEPLLLGAVRPRGWLADQLRVQADGLTGHIDEFWPDLGPQNVWLGGTEEGWERGPYYLDGLIPLAYLLDDERLKTKATRWVEAIVASQHESGWIGPVQAPNRRVYDVWPVMIVLKALTQYQEATGDPRIVPLMLRLCRFLRRHLETWPLFEWGRFRWADLVISIHWLYNRTGDEWLLDLARLVEREGFRWDEHFGHFRYTCKLNLEECDGLDAHVVNNAMAIKTGGVWWRQSGAEHDRAAVYEAIAALDAHHGQVTGVFTGDEHFAGKHPSQGTELCAVVEYMFSLELLAAIVGAPAFGDRLERITYNALPATFKPDMWAHQYDQQVNQVLCTIAPRQWTNNNDDSNIYGLEPNFGCCTANMHQGWPKFAAHLWMRSPEGGLAAIAYAPCEVTATVAGDRQARVTVETSYPFDEHIRITLQLDHPAEFPLHLRIPGWAEEATVAIAGGAPETVDSGRCHVVRRRWEPGDTIELRFPMPIRVERRYQGAISIVRGPLVYGLKIGEEWTLVRGEPPHGDWEVRPTTPWNYGLLVDPEHPEQTIEVVQGTVGSMPFNPEHPPVTLRVKGRRIPEWTLELNSAGSPPPGPVASSEAIEELTLIPYGSTNLRVAEFPLLES